MSDVGHEKKDNNERWKKSNEASRNNALWPLFRTLLPDRYRHKSLACCQLVRLTILRLVGVAQSAALSFRLRRRNEFGHRRGSPHWNARKMCLQAGYVAAVTAVIMCVYRVHVSWKKRHALETYLDARYGFHPEWHPRSRAERFPSTEQRVKLYMSNWYIPPCEDYRDGQVMYAYRDNPEDQGKKTVIVSIPHSSDSVVESMAFDTIIRPDYAFWLERRVAEDCAMSRIGVWFDAILNSKSRTKYDPLVLHRKNMRPYCRNAIEILDISDRLRSTSDHIEGNLGSSSSSSTTLTTSTSIRRTEGKQPQTDVPIIIQFGDHFETNLDKIEIPHIRKIRASATPQDVEKVVTTNTTSNDKRLHTKSVHGAEGACYRHHPRAKLDIRAGAKIFPRDSFSSILWILETNRHFDMLADIPYLDIPWERKRNMAVWRGSLTGTHNFRNDLSDRTNCLNIPRCRLVLDGHKSDVIDAGLVNVPDPKIMPGKVDGITLRRNFLSFSGLLQYKAIISIQGNDVGSGLKWSLLSRSVVLMPPPTITSWAMEELLVPWVHYVPLKQDVSDAEEKMQWVLQNDDKARRIAERATLFMHDMIFHPDAAADDRAVKEEMIRRYRKYFVPARSAHEIGDEE